MPITSIGAGMQNPYASKLKTPAKVQFGTNGSEKSQGKKPDKSSPLPLDTRDLFESLQQTGEEAAKALEEKQRKADLDQYIQSRQQIVENRGQSSSKAPTDPAEKAQLKAEEKAAMDAAGEARHKFLAQTTGLRGREKYEQARKPDRNRSKSPDKTGDKNAKSYRERD